MSIPTRDDYFDLWSQLHGGYRPESSWLVKTWLTLVHWVARPLVLLRVPPTVVTLFGGAVAGLAIWPAAVGGRWCLLAALIVVVSGLVDNLDGAVAVMTGKQSRWGAVLDSSVDRCADVAYVVALWAVGAPVAWCVVAGALMGFQEYARARAGSVGMDDVGVVTVWERPTRVIVTAMFLLGAGIYTGAAGDWATTAVGVWIALGVVGIVQLLVVVRRRLR